MVQDGPSTNTASLDLTKVRVPYVSVFCFWWWGVDAWKVSSCGCVGEVRFRLKKTMSILYIVSVLASHCYVSDDLVSKNEMIFDEIRKFMSFFQLEIFMLVFGSVEYASSVFNF